jgi:hypothetical protein
MRSSLKALADNSTTPQVRRLALAGILLAGCVSTAVAGAAEKKAGAASGKAAPRADSVAGLLKSAFDEGYSIGPSRLKAAERQITKARSLDGGDWRIDYALGLVLVKQSQMKAAVAQLETAARDNEAANWPAWQALIWCQFVDKQYERGFQSLDHFAARVKEAARPDEPSEAQRSAALWIGQLLESLVRCDESKKLRDQVGEQEVLLMERLGSELSESVEAGREMIRERDAELGREAEAASAETEKSKKRRKQDESDKLEKKADGIKETRENAARSAEEWKKGLDDALSKSEKQLGKLESDYQDLERQAAAHMEAYTNTGQLYTRYLIATPPGANLLEVRNQMETYRSQYNWTISRMSAVAQQATVTMQERARAITDYEQATGQLVKENAKLDKWSARLNDQKKKLVEKAPAARPGKAAKGTRTAAPEKKPPASLRTFLLFNLEHERDRLLASFAVHGVANESGPNEK